jgi:arylamine N-acetyltransferase
MKNSELIKNHTYRAHMVILVTIDSIKYFVEVCYGSSNPPLPIPLLPSSSTPMSPPHFPFRVRLHHGPIPGHSLSAPEMWIYSYENVPAPSSTPAPGSETFTPGLCFYDNIEFFPEDFEIINYPTMAHPDSFFVKSVVAKRAIYDEQEQGTTGWVSLFGDTVKRLVGKDGKEEILEELKTEDDRVDALARWFGIRLTGEEREAIVGRPSCLPLSRTAG